MSRSRFLPTASPPQEGSLRGPPPLPGEHELAQETNRAASSTFAAPTAKENPMATKTHMVTCRLDDRDYGSLHENAATST